MLTLFKLLLKCQYLMSVASEILKNGYAGPVSKTLGPISVALGSYI